MNHTTRLILLCALASLLLPRCGHPAAPLSREVTPAAPPIIHEPQSPDLPPPRPPQARAFRLAAHTLFLDLPLARLATQAGFDTIVQVLPWRDLNPRPDYYNWQSADDMVRVAQTHNLDLVVRLDLPPLWAQRANPADLPFDRQAYLDFVGAATRRYQGYILGYIIWNEPNLAEEWGGWVARPSQYSELLCQASAHIRQADPNALVIAAGLAPTNEFSARAMDDRDFLRQMLASDIADCFDVLAAHDYGYGLPPDDPHGNHAGLNLARLIDLHAVLENAGVSKPIWITELGYTIQPGLHPHVSPEEQADYLLGAFERVRHEWPWVTMFTIWNLSYASDNAEMQGFSIIESDLSPRPAFDIIPRMRHQLDVPNE